MRLSATRNCAALLLALLVCILTPLNGQDSKEGGTVEVRVTYTGTGTIDESHKAYVVSWDSPAFADEKSMGQVIPLALVPVSANHAIAVFKSVTKSPVYFSVAYDPDGKWDGQSGPPPAGTSLGLYSKTPGKPEPVAVTPGKTTKIDLTFDDSIKMK